MFNYSDSKFYNTEIEEMIEITKSNSQINGVDLAKTHIFLGQCLGKYLIEEEKFNPTETTVVALMRGGIFFAQGIYYAMNCKFDIIQPKYEHYQKQTKKTIIVDSVINTGNTIKPYINDPDIYFASCVTNEKALNLIGDKLFTIRISKNTFEGSTSLIQKDGKGPDTTLRLFNLL